MMKREEQETNFQSFPAATFFIVIRLCNMLYTRYKLQFFFFFNLTGVFVGQLYLGLLDSQDSVRVSYRLKKFEFNFCVPYS